MRGVPIQDQSGTHPIEWDGLVRRAITSQVLTSGPRIREAAAGWATRTFLHHPNRNRFLSRPNRRSGSMQSYAYPAITKGHITPAWTGGKEILVVRVPVV